MTRPPEPTYPYWRSKLEAEQFLSDIGYSFCAALRPYPRLRPEPQGQSRALLASRAKPLPLPFGRISYKAFNGRLKTLAGSVAHVLTLDDPLNRAFPRGRSPVRSSWRRSSTFLSAGALCTLASRLFMSPFFCTRQFVVASHCVACVRGKGRVSQRRLTGITVLGGIPDRLLGRRPRCRRSGPRRDADVGERVVSWRATDVDVCPDLWQKRRLLLLPSVGTAHVAGNPAGRSRAVQKCQFAGNGDGVFFHRRLSGIDALAPGP